MKSSQGNPNFPFTMVRTICACAFLLCSSHLMAQFQPEARGPIKVTKIEDAEIRLDGRLDEAVWQQGKTYGNFWQWFPTDSVKAEYQTDFELLYDDENVYIGIKCYSQGEDYITPSLRRDFRAGGSDNITLLFDTFNDGRNAFVFGTNPYGVNREALIANGGNSFADWNSSWDNKWQAEAHIDSGFWSAEFIIPFKTLRYNEGSKKWRFNCYRFDTQNNENTTLTQIPRNQIVMNLAFMSELEWEEPLGKPGANVSLIPYVTAGYNKNHEEGTPANNNFDVGGDAKISLTPGLNLDLTVNPDFSQVEVDQQVANLDRFEIFFPERRQFFLENADLFSAFGNQRIRPFFSRRIGVARDTSTGQNIENPILFGARLSGKLNDNWRIGLLNMQTAKDDDAGLSSFNYTVAALQRKLFSRDNLAFVFVNKQAFQDSTEDFSFSSEAYDRLAGLEYNLSSADNRWNGKAFYHHSMSEKEDNNAFAHGLTINYLGRRLGAQWAHEWVGDGFDAPVGFVPRRGFFRINPLVQLINYGTGSMVQHGPGIQADVTWDKIFGYTDHNFELFYEISFRNFSTFRAAVSNQYTFLFNEFDPSRSGAVPLEALTDYNYTALVCSLRSDRRQVVAADIETYAGQFFNGWRAGADGTVTVRYQPLGSLAMNISYNYIDLPDPYAQTNVWLIGPRVDFTFTKEIFLTTFFQYNSQLDNVNINTRFQWRFAPASDFFLVYTDNYNSNNFNVKNRALIAKLTYWLNI